MARKILVEGEPGTGKSTAAENLDPSEVFYICADRKELPFKNWKKNYKTVLKDNGKLDLQQSNYFETDSPATIISLMKAISDSKPETKIIIVDTITNVMVKGYMSRAKEKGYEKFTDLAVDTYNILSCVDDLRDDLTVIIVSHTQDSKDADDVLKTRFKVVAGKMIGDTFEPESMFTVVLQSEVIMEDNVPHYYFVTQNNGKNTCKSPRGMFKDLRIPNDYKYVIEEMKNYYGD